jgi:hypothetical protein
MGLLRFDEFNRIKIEVISVVAMQILSILNALTAKVPWFSFMGVNISCNPNCGIVYYHESWLLMPADLSCRIT